MRRFFLLTVFSMERQLLRILLISFAISSEALFSLCCPLSCAAPDCRCIQQSDDDFKCIINDKKDKKYSSMRDQCCSSTASPSPSTSVTDDSSCSSPSSISFSHSNSSSSSLVLSPHPIGCTKYFNLSVYWSVETSALQSRQYRVDVLESSHTGSPIPLHCHYIRKPISSLTVAIAYDEGRSGITVKLVDIEKMEVLNVSKVRRSNCYSLFSDLATRNLYCGAKDSGTEHKSSVNVTLLPENDGTAIANISWFPPSLDQNYTHYIKIKKRHTQEISIFDVSSKTSVIIKGFNSSAEYELKIYPIIKCAGMHNKSRDWQPCGYPDSITLDFSLAISSPPLSPSSTLMLSSLSPSFSLAISSPPLSPSSTLMLSSLSPSFSLAISSPPLSPSSTLMLSSLSPSSSLTISLSTPSPSTTSGLSSPTGSDQRKTLVIIISISATGGVLLVLCVLLCVAVCMIRHKDRYCHKKVHPDPRAKLPNESLRNSKELYSFNEESIEMTDTCISSTLNHSTNQSTNQSPYIELPQTSPQPLLSVLVLCSLSSPKDDLELVSVLVTELTARHIQPTAPTHTPVRELRREWLERWVWEADAVLLFCNRQLFEEWSGERAGEGYPCIGLWMSQLINTVPNFNKFAYVYAEDAGREFCNLKSIGMHFRLSETEDLSPILNFIRNLPAVPNLSQCM